MQSILCQTLGLKPKEMPEPQELDLYMLRKATTFYDTMNYGGLYQVDFRQHCTENCVQKMSRRVK